MMALQNHYGGKSQSELRKQVDEDDINMLFYRNKTNLSFEKYVTRTKQTFIVLESYNVPLYEEDKVRKILDHINFPQNNLKPEVKNCRSSHSVSSETSSTYLSTVISSLSLRNSHHQEGMNRSRSSTHLGEEEEEIETSDLKADQAVVWVFEEATEEEAKEIEIKVKMMFT